MRFNFLIGASAAFAALFGMTSCLSTGSGSDNYTYTQAYTRQFNAIFENGAGDAIYRQGLGYQVEYNTSDMKSKIEISGLSLPGASYSTLSLKDLTWTYEKGWKKINVRNITPTTSLAAPTFTSFNFSVYDRMITSTSYYPCMNVNYVIGDNQYLVYSYPSGIINVGETTVSAVGCDNYTIPSESAPVYYIQLYDGDTNTNLNDSEQRVALVTLQNMTFTATDIAKDLRIKVPYDIKADGAVYMEADDLEVSQITGSTLSSLEGYKISNLRCITNAANYMVLTFTCTITKDSAEQQYMVRAVATTPEA